MPLLCDEVSQLRQAEVDLYCTAAALRCPTSLVVPRGLAFGLLLMMVMVLRGIMLVVLRRLMVGMLGMMMVALLLPKESGVLPHPIIVGTEVPVRPSVILVSSLHYSSSPVLRYRRVFVIATLAPVITSPRDIPKRTKERCKPNAGAESTVYLHYRRGGYEQEA